MLTADVPATLTKWTGQRRISRLYLAGDILFYLSRNLMPEPKLNLLMLTKSRTCSKDTINTLSLFFPYIGNYTLHLEVAWWKSRQGIRPPIVVQFFWCFILMFVIFGVSTKGFIHLSFHPNNIKKSICEWNTRKF